MILGKYFSPEDRKFLIETYLKDRARIDKTLLPDEYEPVRLDVPEGEEHLYKPGMVGFHTKHATFVTGSQSQVEKRSEWIDVNNQEATRARRNHMMSQFESFWAYQEYAGCVMRFWGGNRLQKYAISVSGTLANGFQNLNYGNGGGGGGCTIGGPNMLGIFHEFGHGMYWGRSMWLGGGETSCDTMQIMGDSSQINKTARQVGRPWKNFFQGAYPGGGGYEMWADDGNWGYAIVTVNLTLCSGEDSSPMHSIAHLGEERGIWPEGQGIRGMGAAIGQMVLSGFARLMRKENNRAAPKTMEPDKLSDINVKEITGVPNRLKDPLVADSRLMAAYECVGPETSLFEDYLDFDPVYQIAHLYDGVLAGKPGYDKADGGGAPVFNGRDQYAEMTVDACDLGEIMLHLRLRPETIKGKQAILDCGGDMDNRFWLELGKGGGLVLNWTVAGKHERLVSPPALKAGEWTEVRLEIGGKTVALYADNEKVAEKATSFRPADVFPGHLGRRNFVFRGRDDKQPNCLQGALDYLRVYSEVPEGFAALAEVPILSPTKVMPEVLEKIKTKYRDRPYLVPFYSSPMRTSGYHGLVVRFC